MWSEHIQKDICKKEKNFLEKPIPTGCYSGWESESGTADKVAPGQLISSEKIKGTAMGYAGKWFILVLVCAYSCLSNGYLKMPELFNQEGEASEHKQYSLRAKCTTSVWRVSSALRAKVPLNLEKQSIWGHWNHHPSLYSCGNCRWGSVVTQPIRGVGGRW